MYVEPTSAPAGPIGRPHNAHLTSHVLDLKADLNFSLLISNTSYMLTICRALSLVSSRRQVLRRTGALYINH